MRVIVFGENEAWDWLMNVEEDKNEGIRGNLFCGSWLSLWGNGSEKNKKTSCLLVIP
jgi:hypothetical protein